MEETATPAADDAVVEAGYTPDEPGTPSTVAERRHEQHMLARHWAILPEALIDIAALAAREDTPEMQAARGRRPGATTVPVGSGGSVAVIPLQGTITPRGGLLSLLFGIGGGLQGFRDSFREALADDSVSAIVFDVDSPGGLIDLVPETAAEIRGARGKKPMIAVANTLAASAAYWIAAQADEIVVTPSAQVGSIGVFTVHQEASRLTEAMGVKTTIISAGEYKTEGNPYEPLSKTARASIQAQVDDLYGMFVADVAAGRDTSAEAVRAGYGQGRAVLAAQAVQVGLADRVDTLEGVLARLTAAPAAASADDAPTASAEDAPTVGADDAPQTSPLAGDDNPPTRAGETSDDKHPVVDYLSRPMRERAAWDIHPRNGSR